MLKCTDTLCLQLHCLSLASHPSNCVPSALNPWLSCLSHSHYRPYSLKSQARPSQGEGMLAGLSPDCPTPGPAPAPARPSWPARGAGAKVTREAGPQHPPVTTGPGCYSRLQLGSARPREVRQRVHGTGHPHGTSGSSGRPDRPWGQRGAGPWP